MNQQRIQQVALSLGKVDSRDTAAQAALLGELALLSNELELEGDWIRAHSAQAATQLLQYLTQLGCIGPEGIIKVVTTLVSSLGEGPDAELEHPLPEELDDESPTREQAARAATEIAGARPASPRAPLPTLRGIDLSNSRTDLRMINDCLLGEVMIQMGAVSRDQLEQALEVQGATGMRIGEALVDVGAATWDQIQKALQHQEDQQQR